MTALADAVADYAAAVPLAEALIALPDADGTAARGQPASRFPGNGAAFNATMDALEGAIRIEQTWRSQAAGRVVPRRPMSMTGMVLKSLLRLAETVTDAEQQEAARSVTRWTTAILQLPAVDREERPQRVPACCPYCGFHMLRLYARAGRVTCLRYGACFDADGLHPVGHADRNRITGDGEVVWHDGLVT